MIRVHILADNTVRKRGMIAEHGLSLWIEKDEKKILFDTGQSSVFYHNSKIIGINLEETDSIVISHGHYDHCGGLQYLPCRGKAPPIYVHPDAFIKKYISHSNQIIGAGLPFKIDDYKWLKNALVYTRQPLWIEKEILVSGEIPCSNTFEEVPENLYIEHEGEIINDMMLDEQMLIVEDNGEIAVFLGCSHPGIINSVKYAQNLIPDKRIKLLVAGMHLQNVSPIRLQMTIQHLMDINIKKIVPLHCTGFDAMCEMKRFLGKRCAILSVGDSIEV